MQLGKIFKKSNTVPTQYSVPKLLYKCQMLIRLFFDKKYLLFLLQLGQIIKSLRNKCIKPKSRVSSYFHSSFYQIRLGQLRDNDCPPGLENRRKAIVTKRRNTTPGFNTPDPSLLLSYLGFNKHILFIKQIKTAIQR